MTFYKTTEKLISKNYPYGFRLKTDKIDYLEFDNRKGFRHCSKTINPKTGLENKPKKSTYSNIVLLGRDDNGHVKSLHLDFYDQKDIDNIIKTIDKNFDLFTQEQIEYIYIKFLGWIKITMYAKIQYCNSKLENLKPLFNNQINILVKGVKSKGAENIFSQISFDWEAIEATEEKGYNPFKIKSYGV